MSDDPRDYFPVDADLWRQPGDKKLMWWQRKVAIYLRQCAGPKKDGKEVRENLVLRPLARIAADTNLSTYKVEKAIQKLRKWPSRRRPLIQRRSGTEITLAPLSRKFVRCPVWLWESPLQDDLKDVLLFISSCFTGKSVNGAELFDCNLYGTKQRSILSCCYLSGGGYKKRRECLKSLVSTLFQYDLMMVETGATNKKAMVVRLDADEPTRTVSKVISGLRGAQQPTHEVHSNWDARCIANPSEVHSNVSSGAYTTKSFSKSSSPTATAKAVACPFANPAPKDAPRGTGRGSKLEQRSDQQLIELLGSSRDTIRLLEFCCQETGLERGNMSFEQSASSLYKLVQEIEEPDRAELLVADLIWAFGSIEWNGLSLSLGLRLSQKFRHRLKQELLRSLDVRRHEAEVERKKSPAGKFQGWIEAGVFGVCREDVEAGQCRLNDPQLNLVCLTWDLFPEHKNQFKDDDEDPELSCLSCPPPTHFLSPEEVDLLQNQWIEATFG